MLNIRNGRCRANRKLLRAGVFALASITFVGCDFEVINPGPVHDQNLDDPAAHAGIVTGAIRGTLDGFSLYAQQGAAIVRELAPAGAAGAGGHFDEIELGTLSPLDRHPNDAWVVTQQGRWVAEHAIERFGRVMGDQADSHAPLGQAYLWAGIANRILGEHLCNAVFDGGPPESYLSHFTRAVDYFTNAENIGAALGDDQTRTAAIALRAAAHVHLGNWAEAVADASQVPSDFTYAVVYPQIGGGTFNNKASVISRHGTFWHTVWEVYFPDTGDPRAAWGHDPDVLSNTARAPWGEVIPFYYPLKYHLPRSADEREVFAPNSTLIHSTPVNLATGREMQLIRAEAALEQDQAAGIPEAMTLINAVRQLNENYFTGETLAPATASNLEEAWAALKMERHAELLLEGRRFGDRKRWAVNDTPGALHPLEYIPDNHVQAFGVPKEPHLCFPIPRDERERNPNIPTDFQDPMVSG